MTRAYFEDTDRLGIGRPDAEPLASETIEEIVELIEALIESGHAYESGGDVYFRVRSFDGYGKLSNRNTEDMDQGEEAGTESLKEDRLDFALWKAHKEGEDTSWDSPWGKGRPGWHIECSAMAEAELGASFAIHGGGLDLVFPHHENEIAQSEAARGVPLARIWMHNGMVEIDAEKMSKSEGNIFQLSEALDRFEREAVVAYLVSGHYRQPLDFSEQVLEQSAAGVERLRNFLREQGTEGGAGEEAAAYRERFLDALADDFNTADGARRGVRPGRGGQPARAARGRSGAGRDARGARPGDAGRPRGGARRRGAAAARRARAGPRASATSSAPTELRDELAAAGWEVRDGAEGARLVRRG